MKARHRTSNRPGQQRTNAACLCASLPTSLHEDDMPDVARAVFVWQTKDREYIAHCAICRQHWQFDFLGRQDIPTFEKLDPRTARLRIDAWHAAKPERDAKKAQWAAQAEAWVAKVDTQEKAFAAAEARAATPLSRVLRIIVWLGFGAGILIALPDIVKGGDPPPERLLLAIAAFGIAIASAAWHHLRVR